MSVSLIQVTEVEEEWQMRKRDAEKVVGTHVNLILFMLPIKM
jgi:hypothetical protein